MLAIFKFQKKYFHVIGSSINSIVWSLCISIHLQNSYIPTAHEQEAEMGELSTWTQFKNNFWILSGWSLFQDFHPNYV